MLLVGHPLRGSLGHMVDQYQNSVELRMARGEAEVLVAWRDLGRRRQMEGLVRTVLWETFLEEASYLGQADTSGSQREEDGQAFEVLLALGAEGW